MTAWFFYFIVDDHKIQEINTVFFLFLQPEFDIFMY